MPEAYVMRRMIEEQHGITSLWADPPCSPTPKPFLPSGRLVELFYYDDDGVENVAHLWQGPGPSIGSVQPTRRTKAHSRGYIYDHRTNRRIGFSSTYELNCALVFLANRRVVDIEDQPPAVSYVADDGTKHKHRYDFRVTFDTGEIWAVDCKPSKAVASSGLEDVRRCARKNLAGFAHRDILVTEKTASRGKAWNAKKIVRAQFIRDDDHCRKMVDMLQDINGAVSAYWLARQYRSFADGLNAVWCLMYDGVVKPRSPHTKLVDDPWVYVRPSAARSALV
jgi:hypothetical protein